MSTTLLQALSAPADYLGHGARLCLPRCVQPSQQQQQQQRPTAALTPGTDAVKQGLMSPALTNS